MFAPVCRGGSRQGRAGRYGIGPYMGCSRRRGVCGRGMPLPYMPSGNDRPNGIAAAARANVGRDALIPPHPAAARSSAGGINPAPTGKFCVSGKSGGRDVCPGLQGMGMPLPYMPSGNDRPNGIATAARANVGRDALIPPGPAAAGMFPVLNFNGAAGVNARPTDPGKHGGQPGNATPAAIANPCRGRCSHRPGVFAAARGSAGGINPAPTGKFFVSGKPGGRNVCPGLQGRYAARQGGPIWNRPLHGLFAAAGMFPVLNFNGAAGVNARPTDPGKHGGHPGKCNPRGTP